MFPIFASSFRHPWDYLLILIYTYCLQTGLDITLLVFIVIITILILGLIIILLIYWCNCCKPSREQEEQKKEQQEKIINIEKHTDSLEKELGKTEIYVEEMQKNMSKLEKFLENSESQNVNTQKTQLLLEAEQRRMREESKKVDDTIFSLQEAFK